ncbi:hypothetical protein [Lactiplantibacillus plantarum]|uniref:hypothetical protein n=1 Tax=Lactiplantibacillus plantarum TaxID=1590 RepID=UPI003F53C04A
MKNGTSIYVFDNKDFQKYVIEDEIKLDKNTLTIPFEFETKDEYYNTLEKLNIGYVYSYKNQEYKLESNRGSQSHGYVGDHHDKETYQRVLTFKR